MSLLANALNTIKVCKRVGKTECKIPASKLIAGVLKILQKEGYIKEYEFVDEKPAPYFIVRAIGPINAIGVISPRFSIKKDEFEDWEKQYLPARDIGLLILTTPKGLMTNREAKAQGIGGKLIAYVY